MTNAQNGSVLQAQFQRLHRQALQARMLLDRPAKAADAVYDLRLALRISRILRHFARKDPAYDAFSRVLDLAYRATSPVRDRQVGIARIRLLETGWPRNRRRPSTGLSQALRASYPQLGRDMDVLGLPGALILMESAIARVERKVVRAKLIRRAERHAERLRAVLSTRMETALARHRMKDWHRLRLAIKHYRFWVDVLAGVLPKGQVALSRALKPLQVALGDAHDGEVLMAWLPEIPDAPLDDWRAVLMTQKQADLERALALLSPLMASPGQLADGIS
ncbi:MAG: CHAD domain-containing protein [Paludibacterium sp.]|uniref:CHAD domain-containing protein n=1 Tax=Paludibacterium sp. TaxID=1917523 RepID=UPI0026001CD4|nr:CHAD domain-containing protein [Paludibacterium sp.]MBV8048420.1 CHAD domain-containing protein [Paludibacterium sp.]